MATYAPSKLSSNFLIEHKLVSQLERGLVRNLTAIIEDSLDLLFGGALFSVVESGTYGASTAAIMGPEYPRS